MRIHRCESLDIAAMKKLCCSSDRNIDIISYLPDPIRSHIVSSLPMKDALRTKILSRRWRNVCSSLSTLEFIQDDFKNSKCDFRDFVDETHIFHDSSNIQKYSLHITIDDTYIHSRRVNSWIYFAVQHNVQHLALQLYMSSPAKVLRLPCCLFTCSSLSVLHLVSDYDRCDFKWPTSIKFPMLKIFQLEGVKFDDENLTNKLFSSNTFPVLEDLFIEDCFSSGSQTLSISIQSLDYLELDWGNKMVNLDIPSIREIEYRGFSPPNMTCASLSSLIRATFHFSEPDTISNDEACYNSTRRILMGLHNVEYLSLSGDVIECIARGRDILACFPTSCCSLKDLHLDIMPTENYVKVITFLLRIYPNLQTLYLSIFTPKNYDKDLASTSMINMEGYWQGAELCPRVHLKHLRSVEIVEFGGTDIELDIIRCLFESASNLEKIDISCSDSLEQTAEKLTAIHEKMSLFNKVYSSATISLE